MTAKPFKFPPFSQLILHEDDDIMVVIKPLHMASLDDKGRLNLLSMARRYNPELRLCHRLDRNTSGVLVMAKHDESYRHISIQFQERQVKKIYHTLVSGIQHLNGLEIDLPLFVSTNKKVTISHQQGKPSLTRVYTEEAFGNYSLLRCEPVTGRMHQIRVHLAAQRMPIVGDELYGGKDIFLSEIKRKYKPSGRREESPINQGYLLHARSLTFRHPVSEETRSFEAPYPKNFATTLRILGKYNPAP